MLERATTCLESGGRRLLRGSKRSFPSRRTLRTSFWHHGPGDLDLPAWWSTVLRQPVDVLELEQNSDTNLSLGSPGITYGTGKDGLFLDFLYPVKTLALMRRISDGRDTWNSRSVHGAGRSRVRQYSTKSGKPEDSDNNEPDDGQVEHESQPGHMDEESEVPEEFEDNDEDEFGQSSPMGFPPREPEDPVDVPDPGIQDQSDTGEGDVDALSAFDNVEQGPREKRSRTKKAAGDKSADEHNEIDISANEDHGRDISADEYRESKDSPMIERSPSEALDELQQFFAGPEVGHGTRASLVRQLYQQTREEDRKPGLIADVLDHVCSARPFGYSLAAMSLGLFDALQPEHRRASSYKSAIFAYLARGESGKAGLVHNEAKSRFLSFSLEDFGSGPLIAHAIRNKQWDLAISAYAGLNQDGPAWSDIEEDPNLLSYADSFFRYLRRVRWISGDRDTRVIKTDLGTKRFALIFSDKALKQASWRTASPEDQVQLWRFFQRMKKEHIMHFRHCETALHGLLGSEELAKLTDLPKIIITLYKFYLSGASHSRQKPRRNILHRLLFRLSNLQPRNDRAKASIPGVVRVWREHYEELGVKQLTLLMRTYARLGKVSEVHDYFELYLKTNGGQLIELAHFRPLLHVHARRADVEKTQLQFNRISEEFGLKPDRNCWNILHSAYAQQDDLEGALQCLNRMLKSDVRPDAFSFSPVLGLMGQRGDVDGVRNMFAIAEDLDEKILESTWTIGALVSALVNSGDMRSAENVAEQIYQRQQDKQVHGPMTPLMNMLITGYARKRDVPSTRRLYQHMQLRGIQPDPLTYAGFMLGLMLVHQTNAAWKILRSVVPSQNIRELGFHYAICMSGFIREERYLLVEVVERRRKRRMVPDSLSTRLALELSKARQGSQDQTRMLPKDHAQRPLPAAQGLMHKYLEDGDTGSLVATEPQLGLDWLTLNNADLAYWDILITTYGSKGSFQLVEKVLAEHHEHQRAAGNDPEAKSAPLRMVRALMTAHYYAGRYEEVEAYWYLALKQAAPQAQLPAREPAVDARGTPEPKPKEIAPARRHILAKVINLYMRSLEEQMRHPAMQSTVENVLKAGYTLDNQSWNRYVQAMARSGRIYHAFYVCEVYMMSAWPGWQQRTGGKKRHRTARGWHHISIPSVHMPPELVIPQYKTMVILAAALQFVRRTDAIGGKKTVVGDVTEQILDAKAPRLMSALKQMPYIADELQKQFLSGGM